MFPGDRIPISQASEAFCPHHGTMENMFGCPMCGQSPNDSYGHPDSLLISEDPNVINVESLVSELNNVHYLTGPAEAQPMAVGTMYNETHSPASIRSELSFSDVEYASAHNSVTREEGIFYPSSSRRIDHSDRPHVYAHQVSSDSGATSDPMSQLHIPSLHRSYSGSSAHRTHIASQAVRQANERRRVHEAQFKCDECQQTFTTPFALNRHQLSHTGERRFICRIPGCNQRFFNDSDCKRHEKSKKRHAHLIQS
ncbi:hypothetical protein F5141DRAFT_1061459 [Pisolithus sp. B1]|nr:hypothetical protein F5141DRAFT_1061459 [Pisolithus sp. B1]